MVHIECFVDDLRGFQSGKGKAGINIASKAETKTIEKETSFQLRQLRRATKTRKEERKETTVHHFESFENSPGTTTNTPEY